MTRLTPAVVRSLDILELFLSHATLTAPEVIRLSGFPRASVHEILNTLAARGWLYKEDDGSFTLGLQTYLVGSAYAARLDIQQLGDRIVRKVASQCGETVNLGIRDGGDVVYLVIADSTHPVRLASRRAGRLPVWATAIGKCLISEMTPEELDEVLPDCLAALTPDTITDRKILLDQLAGTRAAGACYESGESTPGVACAAAPVRGADGRIVASISVSVPSDRWSRRSRSDWGALVARGADELSILLGYLP